MLSAWVAVVSMMDPFRAKVIVWPCPRGVTPRSLYAVPLMPNVPPNTQRGLCSVSSLLPLSTEPEAKMSLLDAFESWTST